ncbi:MAG: glycosyltransferase family 39 protein [Actinobacteria bacterium]|nr:glycosyltransferase family 39 protein [Actinomycetota bacterium]
MKTSEFIKKYYIWLLLSFCIAVRALLINVNFAEVGDSNNFLLLADQISKRIFPAFTNRLPLYPLLLAAGVKFMDGYLWGRILSLLFSVGSIVVLYKLAIALFKKREIAVIACLLTVLNPIFSQHSMRVYSEVLLLLLVLGSFYFFYRKNLKLDFLIVGFLTILATMTRYEGSLLFVVFLLSYVILKEWRKLIYYSVFTLSFFIIVLGFIYFRSGVLPSRFLEGVLLVFRPREYNLVPTYLVHLLFISGFPMLVYFEVFGFSHLIRSFKKFAPLILYLGLDLFLIYKVHPGARYFYVLVPIFSLVIAYSIVQDFIKNRLIFLVVNVASIGLFIYLALTVKPFFVFGTIYSSLVTLLLSLVMLLICWLYKQPNGGRIVKNLVIAIVLVSLFNLSSSITWHRRYDYYTIAQASRYLANVNGRVAYYDDSGVSAWFLRDNGVYFNEELNDDEQLAWLKENNVKFAIWTNEYNEGSELTVLQSKSYSDNFRLEKSFSVKKEQWLAAILGKYGLVDEKYLPVSMLYESEIYEVRY